MKRVWLVALLLIFILPTNSCSLLKKRSVNTTLESSKVKNDISVKKETVSLDSEVITGSKFDNNKIFNEEITYKRSSPAPIELTATFRVDTSASLKGDTALKLVDINNEDISVSIYQNKRTNEMMAKVTTGKSSKSIPFSEMSIKRNYTESTTKQDSSKAIVKAESKKVDSVDKTKTKVDNKKKDTVSEPSSKGMWALFGIAGVLIVVGAIVYLIKNKTKL